MDLLDKRILQHLSAGISSYEELARECNVTRNTVYRRMAALEKKGVTKKTTRTAIDYNKLDITAIAIALNLPQQNQQKLLASLQEYGRVKLLLKAFGAHNVIAVAFCSKGQEGETINCLRSIAENCNAISLDISVGFGWDKIDFTPYDANDVERSAEIKAETIGARDLLVDA